MLLLVSIVASAGIAGEKRNERTFEAPFEDVWKACVSVAAERYAVLQSDKENGVLTFKQGTTAFAWGLDYGAHIQDLGNEKTRVRVRSQKQKQLFGSKRVAVIRPNPTAPWKKRGRLASKL